MGNIGKPHLSFVANHKPTIEKFIIFADCFRQGILATNQTKIVMIYINDHVQSLDVDDALARVSAQRRELALKFRHEGSRRLCLAAYLLLMDGLRRECFIEEPPIFGYSPEGKPFIVDHPDIQFNLSHSGNVAICAISNQPVGIDVETSRKISDSLIDYTMNKWERKFIDASDDKVTAFLEYWTKKEALLKLTGEGIRNDLKDVLMESENYLFESCMTDKYIYSIAKYRDVP